MEVLSNIREIARQSYVLTLMFWSERRGAWKVSVTNALYPLYPVLLLWLLLLVDFLPYSKRDIDAVPFFAEVDLAEASFVATSQLQFAPELLAFAPSSDPEAMNLAENITEALGVDFSRVTLLESFEEVVEASSSGLLAAVYMEGTNITIAHPPLQLLTFAASRLTNQTVTPQDALILAGIVELQSTVNEAVLASRGLNFTGINRVQRLPVPAEVQIENFLAFVLPIMLIDSVFFNLRSLLIEVSLQAERGFRQALILKGLNRNAIWTSAFINHGAFTLVPSTLLTAALYVAGILRHTAVIDALGIFWLNGLAQTAFGVLILSVVGDHVKSKTVFGIGIILFVLFNALFFAFEFAVINVATDPVVRAFFLIYVAAFGHVVFNIPEGELRQTGLSEDIDRNVYWAYYMLVIDIFLYLSLALIIDNLRQWYQLRKVKAKLRKTGESSENSSSANTVPKGIRVKDISVTFRRKSSLLWCFSKDYFNAVDHLDMEIAENEIFCLLGQNGAGKTTILNCLVGNRLPTTGEAWVHGYHVIKDRKELRKNIGVCPQQDTVLDYVPCIDQLITQAQISGLGLQESRDEALRLLEKLDLSWKAHEKPANLSGGQKRRLTLALALVGSPKIIILDEPTTGLDPKIRRTIWELLNSLKKDHTILMTTHSLEEADVLSDKIAIMAKGKIRDIGPSLELKERHGPGYKLHCVKSGNNEEQFNLLNQTVVDYIKGARYDPEQSSGAEATFNLPFDRLQDFPKLFDYIESNAVELGLVSFGLTPSTLEDVFLSLERENFSGVLVQEEVTGQTVQVKVDMQDTVDVLKDKIAVELNVSPKNQRLEFEGTELSNGLTPLSSYKVENGSVVFLRVNEERAFFQENFNDEFAYQQSSYRQFLAVVTQVFLVMTRNPLLWLQMVLFPIALTIGYNYLTEFLNTLNRPPEPFEIDLGALFGPTTYPYFAPSNAQPVVESILQEFAGSSNFSDANDLYRSLNTSAARGGWAFAKAAALSTDVDIDVNVMFDAGPELSTNVFSVGPALPAWYAAPAFFQQVYNGVLSNATGEAVSMNYLEWQQSTAVNSLFGGGSTAFLIALVLGLQTSVITVEMMMIRVTKTKEFILISGMPEHVFWISYYVAHSAVLSIPCFVVYFVLLGFGAGGTLTSSPLAFFVLFALFIGPAVLLGYILSFAFSDEEVAENFSSEIISLSFTIPWVIITFALNSAPSAELENVLTFLLPTYGLFRGLAVLQTADTNQQGLSATEAFDWNTGLGQTYLFLALAQVFNFILLMIMGSGILSRLRTRWNNKILARSEDEDLLGEKGEAVNEEEVNITAVMDGILPPPMNAIPKGVPEEDLKIKCENVHKSFVLQDNSVFRAVQNASLGVEGNSIFGLLGPNGAGKTTLIKCVTGLDGYTMDSGRASIFGHSVLEERSLVLPLMGVCPQHDILIGWLTGRELLTMFATIRGVPRAQTKRMVNYYLKMLDLTPKADSYCKNYSGGNRRRLSVALSMIGSPSAIFMDEPSTGLDPLTRRRLWEFLLQATRKDQDRERCILLTTHSMEEADALCNRIAIMVNSSIRTVGTSQELKSRYGTDRIVVLGVDKSSDEESINEMMASIHPQARRLKESTISSKKYSVPTSGTTWSSIFKSIMANQTKLRIEHFAVSQRSLEDVFIDFADLNATDEELERKRLATKQRQREKGEVAAAGPYV